jgi:hypothetical protein
MSRLDGPNILNAASGLRPREIAVVIVLIVALCAISAIVLF